MIIDTERRSSEDITEVRVHINNFSLTVKNDVLGGNGPIKIFDILTRFVDDAEMLDISEAQDFVVLQLSWPIWKRPSFVPP